MFTFEPYDIAHFEFYRALNQTKVLYSEKLTREQIKSLNYDLRARHPRSTTQECLKVVKQYKKGLREEAKGSLDKAFELISDASQAEYLPAYHWLGQYFLKNGQKLANDGDCLKAMYEYATAKENFEYAAQYGYVPAAWEVYKCYKNGIGCKRDNEKARKMILLTNGAVEQENGAKNQQLEEKIKGLNIHKV